MGPFRATIERKRERERQRERERERKTERERERDGIDREIKNERLSENV